MTTAAPSDVRTWARKQGLTSAERGPLPRWVLEAYEAAHAADPTRTPPAPRAAPDGPSVAERLQRVEDQLAQALARVAELEAQRSRSLLGLRLTL
ncbi:MAG TPA: hypothetical protein VFR07_10280 [Mycobacteriales bacterium]|nr:hypothetical protein [Mycobacteriales bacterium]